MGKTDNGNVAKKNPITKIQDLIGAKMFTLFVLFIAVVVIFTVWAALIGERFLSGLVFTTIGERLVLTSFLSVGSGFLMVSGKLDLSASTIGAFSSITAAACMSYWGMPTGIAILIALAGSAFFGILNAVLVSEFNFAPFIGTMAMSSVVMGVAQRISASPHTGMPMTVSFSNSITTWIANGRILGMPAMLLLALLVFIFYGLVLAKTRFGMNVYLVGGNPQAAQLCGISPRKMTYILFANSGFLAGIAGVIFMSRNAYGDFNAMSGNQFTGLTAAILGGVSFGGGAGNMGGVFMGLMVLSTFDMGTTIVRFSNYWTTVLTGVLLLFALTLDYYNARRVLKSLK